MMPEYQKALELAVNRKYPEALDQLQESVKQVELQVGPNTKFHLFLY